MQIAVGVAAHELAVGGEGDVAFDDSWIWSVQLDYPVLANVVNLTSSHSGGSIVTLPAVLGELQRGASVRDGEARSGLGLVLARFKLVLQVSLVHLVDKVVRTRAQLHQQSIASHWAAMVLVGLGRSRSSALNGSSHGKLESSHS